MTLYYKKRARDSGASSPTYVTWASTDPTTVYPGVPPFGGPLVEEFLIDVWDVPSAAITVQDEGVTLSASVDTINFVGAGVTATGTNSVTVTIPGGGGSGLIPSATATTDQTATSGQLVVVDLAAASGPVTITAPATANGDVFGVKVLGLSELKYVTIARPLGSTALFNRTETSYKLFSSGQTVEFYCDGTDWIQVGNGIDSAFTQPYVSPVLSPEAWWLFDGGTDASMYTDRTGHGWDFTGTTTDQVGASRVMTGIRPDLAACYGISRSMSDYGAICNGYAFTLLTLSTMPATSGSVTLAGMFESPGTKYAWQFGYISSNMRYFSSNPTNTPVIYGNPAYPHNNASNYCVYAFTVNAARNSSTFYINGRPISTISPTQIVTDTVSTAYTLNLSCWLAATQLIGFYRSALTAPQIQYVTQVLLGTR